MFFKGDKVDCVKNGKLYKNCTVQENIDSNEAKIVAVYCKDIHNIIQVKAVNVYKPGIYKLCPYCGKIKRTNTNICYLCGRYEKEGKR